MDETLRQGVPQEHREIFERVWKRVMTGSRENCPIAWGEEAAAPAAAPAAGEAAGPAPEEPPKGEEAGTPGEGLAVPCPDHPVSDFPQGEDVGVLGSGCMEWAPLLQELIRRALEDQKEYMKLSRRTGGPASRTFAALTKEKLRQAKRLSAAYFLISGVRYWPQAEDAAAAGSYLGTLRRRFRREQENMAACLAGAEGSGDPSLSQLFGELARENWDSACRIRGLVEQI